MMRESIKACAKRGAVCKVRVKKDMNVGQKKAGVQ